MFRYTYLLWNKYENGSYLLQCDKILLIKLSLKLQI